MEEPQKAAAEETAVSSTEVDEIKLDETVDESESRPRPSVLLWSVLVAIAFVLGLVAGYLIWERPLQAKVDAAEKQVAALQKTGTANQTAAANAAEANAAEAQPTQQVKRYNVPTDDDPALGKADAPITIIEFSDYQCPFCRQWHEQVFSKIKETYGDKVRLVYRDFPLYGLHPEAEAAAEAADCAGEQKDYWDYHNLLFTGNKDLGTDTYLSYAQSLKLNTDTFKKCLDDHKYQAEVKADYDYASQLGVRSTPTFFVNGLAVVGAQPFEVFQQVIDMELAGKIPK